MTAPISMTYYIRNDRMEYFIKTDGESIMITNHKFTFKEKMGIKFSEIITNIIKDFMETNRKEFENSVFKNQLELLKNIKESLEKQN
jgi:aromatic ring-opening dioxygenase LigB subunit